MLYTLTMESLEAAGWNSTDIQLYTLLIHIPSPKTSKLVQPTLSRSWLKTNGVGVSSQTLHLPMARSSQLPLLLKFQQLPPA